MITVKTRLCTHMQVRLAGLCTQGAPYVCKGTARGL